MIIKWKVKSILIEIPWFSISLIVFLLSMVYGSLYLYEQERFITRIFPIIRGGDDAIIIGITAQQLLIQSRTLAIGGVLLWIGGIISLCFYYYRGSFVSVLKKYKIDMVK